MLGVRLTDRFKDMATRFPAIGEVRGLGSMVAIELFEDAERRRPAGDLVKAVVSEAATRGLLLLPCGVYGNVIRVLVPITASNELVDEGMDILEAALGQVTRLSNAA